MLDRMRVLTPCRADWELMGVGDRARSCGQCNRSVYDTLQPNTAASLDVSLEPSGLTMGIFFDDGFVEPSPIPRELLTPIKAIRIVPERKSK